MKAVSSSSSPSYRVVSVSVCLCLRLSLSLSLSLPSFPSLIRLHRIAIRAWPYTNPAIWGGCVQTNDVKSCVFFFGGGKKDLATPKPNCTRIFQSSQDEKTLWGVERETTERCSFTFSTKVWLQNASNLTVLIFLLIFSPIKIIW